MFLRRERGWADTWGLITIGVVLCVVSVLGLTGAFGEVSSVGRFETVVLLGVPLGLFAIGGGIVNIVREGARRRADTDKDVSADPDGTGPERTRPDGMIDR